MRNPAPSPLLKEQADALAFALEIQQATERALRAGAKGAELEANFEDAMRPVLQEMAKRLGVEIEVDVQVKIIGAGRTGGTGKADLLFSNVILELKAPDVFRGAPPFKTNVPETTDNKIAAPQFPQAIAPGNREAVTELVRYIIGRARGEWDEHWRAHLDEYAGVGLDGKHIFFVRYLAPLDSFDVSETFAVSPQEVYPLHRLLVLMRSARKRALSAGALAADFAIVEQGRAKTVNPLAREIVQRFYTKVTAALTQSGTQGAAVRARYAEWRKLFREVVSFEEKEARSKFGELQKLYDIGGRADHFDVAAFFFALSTYYGLLVKMLAAEQLVNYCCSIVTTTLEALSAFAPNTLRTHLYDMEREGGHFAKFQIRNFLEGELFDWYVEPSVWDDELGQAIRALISKLSEYEIATFELRPETTRDLLKDLYQRLIPQRVRHGLGEYYTPDWLAEFTLNEAREFSGWQGDPHTRLLDPACGSGTFLVEAIKVARKWCQENKLNPDQARNLITRNIVGFDLNPLAVLTARANYILALGDLIRGQEGLLALDEPISIPVYLTDSIMVPARPQQAGFDKAGGVYAVDLEVLKELRPHDPPDQRLLHIPAPVVDGGKLGDLADLIREGLARGWNSARFMSEADKRLKLGALYQQQLNTMFEPTGDVGRAQTLLAKLYDDMLALERAGLDGLWPRFLLNRFAPILEVQTRGAFDVIVGNPPWINWESLPDDYRDAQQRLWKEYYLFRVAGSGAKGTSVQHGAGKKDLSMLMTYVAVDKLLKENGHLAFVITQTVFKTEAGEGFRRFVIPDTVTFFAPLRVNDLSAFQPFEGATNRTAVFLVQKNKQVEYPVPYVLWSKHEPISTDDTLVQVQKKTECFELAAEPVSRSHNGIRTDRWLTARPNAIRALRKFTGNVRQEYQAYEGSNTGGANGVYWLEIEKMAGKKHALVSNYLKGAKRKVKQYTNYKIETEYLYPLLRGRDVARWRAEPNLHILMTQDAEKRIGVRQDELRDNAPLTFQWLTQFKKELRERAAFKKFFGNKSEAEFWTMYNVGSYTFSPHKVVWREMATTFTAAVAGETNGKVHIPDHKLMVVPCKSDSEAHYLCALLNSSPLGLAVLSVAINIQFNPHVISRISIPKYDAKNELHKELAAASKAAHKAAAKQNSGRVLEMEQEIDSLAQRLWNLTDDEMQDMKISLRELGGTIAYEDDQDETDDE